MLSNKRTIVTIFILCAIILSGCSSTTDLPEPSAKPLPALQTTPTETPTHTPQAVPSEIPEPEQQATPEETPAPAPQPIITEMHRTLQKLCKVSRYYSAMVK